MGLLRSILLAAGLAHATGSRCPDPSAINAPPTGLNPQFPPSPAANADCAYSCGGLRKIFAPESQLRTVCWIDRGNSSHWPPPAGTVAPWLHTHTVPPLTVTFVQGHAAVTATGATASRALATRINAINSSLVLRHVSMTGFTAPPQPSHSMFEDGGAVFISFGNLTAEYSSFHSNTAGRSGGALNAKDGTVVQIISCLFEGNSAVQFGGGAIRVFQQQHTLVQASVFRSNIAGLTGGAIFITVRPSAQATPNWGDHLISKGRSLRD